MLEKGFTLSPLYRSILLGNRFIFRCLVNTDRQIFQTRTQHWYACQDTKKPQRHLINLEHLALSIALTSPHFDVYFV